MMSTFASVNPATEEIVAEYSLHGHTEVDRIIDAAARAQVAWARRPFHERLHVLRAIGAMLEQHIDDAARLITIEMGKPIAQARAEVTKCAAACAYYADHAEEMLAAMPVASTYRRSDVRFDPLGVVLSIMPWNFPFWQFFRFAIPALAAGNGILLKHAPNTMGCALLATQMCHDAGVPEDLVAALVIDVPDVERVIADRRVRAVTFTGSTRGGAAVAALAGANVKKTVLELGGSDAYIVCDDADVLRAADLCVESRCINSGQSCIAAKRFIVHDDVADVFIDAVTERMAAHVVGDPMREDTTIGPLARKDLRDILADQVDRAVDAGAEIIRPHDERRNNIVWPYGWRPSNYVLNLGEATGWYFKPVVLANVRPGNPACTEELFGPVAAVMRVTSDAEAVAVANASRYGLGAAVFTQHEDRAEFFVRELQAGSVFVNDYVRSDVRLPFGGVKDSGYGRELGVFGLREFVNIKSVVVA